MPDVTGCRAPDSLGRIWFIGEGEYLRRVLYLAFFYLNTSPSTATSPVPRRPRRPTRTTRRDLPIFHRNGPSGYVGRAPRGSSLSCFCLLVASTTPPPLPSPLLGGINFGQKSPHFNPGAYRVSSPQHNCPSNKSMARKQSNLVCLGQPRITAALESF